MLSVCVWEREVREREAEIDTVIGPIEEMYALLARYEVLASLISDLACPQSHYHTPSLWRSVLVASVHVAQRPLLQG